MTLRNPDPRLVKKYGERSFMYTEYPNLRFWTAFQSAEEGDKQYRDALRELFLGNPTVPLMLYVHIPHCPVQCLYCTCHVVISRNYSDIKRYLEVLYQEVELLKRFLEENKIRPNFREVHLGGGSPTYLTNEDFDRLLEKLREVADLDSLDEFAIEIDPRHVKEEGMRYYASKGISRVSFGVQDFDLEVQKAVARVQPAVLTERLIAPELRRLFRNGINFDIICGLPKQTRESMRRTMKKVVEMAPDRICLNYMHFIPQFFPHQLLMPSFPDNAERKMLFLEATEILTEGGYIRTGYDHFAKPADDVVEAMREGKMAWNRMGVTAGRYQAVLGVGVGAVSGLASLYDFQNIFSSPETGLKDYTAAVLHNQFPVFRGHKLSRDDQLRREIIQTIRNYFLLDLRELETKYDIRFAEYFQPEMVALQQCQDDGIVELTDDTIVVTDTGKQFADVVCSKFDVYIRR